MELFANPRRDDYQRQLINNDGFRELMHKFPNIIFFQPDPWNAPWHVQGIVGNEAEGNSILFNFWPHTGKSQRNYCKSVVGWAAAERNLIEAVAEVSFDSNAHAIDAEFDAIDDGDDFGTLAAE